MQRPSTAILAFVVTLSAPVLARADSYEIDRSHSSVLFKVKHLGVGNFYGRFNNFSGTLTLDDARPEASAVTFKLETTSIDTASGDRDKHLRGAGALAVEQHPVVTFQSTAVKRTGPDTLSVAGQLTFRGVTRPVQVEVKRLGEHKEPKGGSKVGFEGTFRFKRSEFGMKGMNMISDEVDVIVSIEAERKAAPAASN